MKHIKTYFLLLGLNISIICCSSDPDNQVGTRFAQKSVHADLQETTNPLAPRKINTAPSNQDYEGYYYGGMRISPSSYPNKGLHRIEKKHTLDVCPACDNKCLTCFCCCCESHVTDDCACVIRSRCCECLNDCKDLIILCCFGCVALCCAPETLGQFGRD
jgi:hypothetical protein